MLDLRYISLIEKGGKLVWYKVCFILWRGGGDVQCVDEIPLFDLDMMLYTAAVRHPVTLFHS